MLAGLVRHQPRTPANSPDRRRVAAPFPYWRYAKPPADRTAERSMEAIRAAVDGFIVQARIRMDARPELYERPENFLEGMLAAQRDGHCSDHEGFGNTFTMLLAGEDTTAHSLSWTAWFMARDLALEHRLADAARAALGDAHIPDSAEAAATFTDGHAVLREAMRLKSTAPMLFLEALKDTDRPPRAAPRAAIATPDVHHRYGRP